MFKFVLFALVGLAQVSVFASTMSAPQAPAPEAVSQSTTSYEVTLPDRTLQKSLYVEALGRTVGYGLGFEVPVSRQITIGLEGSYLGFDYGYGDHVSVTLASPYITAYTGERHRLFATGGFLLDWTRASYSDAHNSIFGSGESAHEAKGFDVFPQVGGGYEFRAASGFIFRLSGYLNVIAGATNPIYPWGGISFGSTL